MQRARDFGGWGLLAVLALLPGLPAQAAAPPALSSEDLFARPEQAAKRFEEFVYTAAERREEAEEKVARVRKALAARKLDGLLLSLERNFNWLTAGGSDNVVWPQRESLIKVLVTPESLHLIADNIEGPRVMTEELNGLGYDWVRYNWFRPEREVLQPLLRGKKIAFDQAATATEYGFDPARASLDFVDLYYPITAGELKKYRWLGRKTVEAMEQVARVIRPGMSERDLQYLLNRELWYWDILPTVTLSAVDERFRTYRHPTVRGAELKNYAALNICSRRWGLVVSTTRMVHFGRPDAALAQAWDRGPRVAAAMLHASRPGNTLGQVLGAAQKAYADIGYPEEWRLHHQGGMIFNIERIDTVKPGDRTRIRPGMVLAWNPTIQGAKFEDTVLVREDGTLENLTPLIDWPAVTVQFEGKPYTLAGLLIRPVTQIQR
jgi:Xaa-Pro aminopeptidase